jgi:hypothetical protein
VTGRLSDVGYVAVVESWCTPDNLWLVDRVLDEPGVGYRIWYDGEPAGELAGDRAALRDWLAARHLDAIRLVALGEDEDPFCE